MMDNSSDNIIKRLGLLLNISDLGGEDWDLVFADPTRIAEFCDVYEQDSLTVGERIALMELIVASYDRVLSESYPQDDLESRVYDLLKQDCNLHKDTIEYWSKLKSHDPTNLWAVSPLMRKILREQDVEA